MVLAYYSYAPLCLCFANAPRSGFEDCSVFPTTANGMKQEMRVISVINYANALELQLYCSEKSVLEVFFSSIDFLLFCVNTSGGMFPRMSSSQSCYFSISSFSCYDSHGISGLNREDFEALHSFSCQMDRDALKSGFLCFKIIFCYTKISTITKNLLRTFKIKQEFKTFMQHL